MNMCFGEAVTLPILQSIVFCVTDIQFISADFNMPTLIPALLGSITAMWSCNVALLKGPNFSITVKSQKKHVYRPKSKSNGPGLLKWLFYHAETEALFRLGARSQSEPAWPLVDA